MEALLDGQFATMLHLVTRGIEATGVIVIVVGMALAAAGFLRDRGEAGAYHQLRATLGRAILLGLELLVAADIINTVAIEPTLTSLAVLAGIVLIRTFLSLSLEVEIAGGPRLTHPVNKMPRLLRVDLRYWETKALIAASAVPRLAAPEIDRHPGSCIATRRCFN